MTNLFSRFSNKIKSVFQPRSEYSRYKYIKNEADYSHLTDRKKYQAMYDEVGTVEANKKIEWREEWMKYFKPDKNSIILELGAHNGPNLIHYGRLGHRVDGVEISDTLIETFNKFAEKEPREVQDRMRMIKEWIEDFKPQIKYDYVLCTEILEHVPSPVEVLKKAAESLKKDGMVYISSPATHWGNNTHVRGVPVEDLKQWLKQAGLKAKKVFDEDGRTFCYAVLA